MHDSPADLERLLRVRPEEPTDHPAVRDLVTRAFGGSGEADAVAALRGLPGVVSLVAVEAGEVIGHVMVSPVGVGAASSAPGLAPLAVHPGRQGRGVGAALVRAALEACRRRSDPVVFVVGDPAYYGRFGFRDASPHGLRYHEPLPAGAFQVAELTPGALPCFAGEVRYHPAFDGL